MEVRRARPGPPNAGGQKTRKAVLRWKGVARKELPDANGEQGKKNWMMEVSDEIAVRPGGSGQEGEARHKGGEIGLLYSRTCMLVPQPADGR